MVMQQFIQTVKTFVFKKILCIGEKINRSKSLLEEGKL